MRRALIVILMLSGLMTSAMAQVSIGIGFPGVRIGIDLPIYPNLVRVPNYPVYYARDLQSNYFFYDGMYWVLQDDDWYASYWYNGPWQSVDREWVPLFILRVPVSYYRSPPRYFSGWRDDAPPRWGEHWGNDWQRQHSDWDRWDRASAPAPAPLPAYQRSYPQDRYPRVEQQAQLHNQNYQYQPRDPVVREHFQAPAPQRTAAPSAPRTTAPVQQSNPSRTRGQADREAAPTQAPTQRATPAAPVRPEQQAPTSTQEATPKDKSEPEAQQRREPPAAARPAQQAPASKQEATPKDKRKPEAQQRRQAPKKDRGNNDPADQDNKNQDNKN